MPQRAGPLRVDVLVAACRRTPRSSAAGRGRRRAPACRAPTKRVQQRLLVVVADAVAGPARLERRLAVAAGPDVGAALEHQRVEPARRSRPASTSPRRVSPAGLGIITGERAARHHPVRDRLLDVLQRLAGEDRPRRVGVEEAGRDADLESALMRAFTSRLRNRRSKSAGVHGRGLVWWQMSAAAISTRRGICSRLTPTAARLARDADLALQRAQPGHEGRAAAASAPTTCASSSNLARHGLGVPGQHGVDHQRVGQAVVQVADGAERVRAGVHRAEVLLERDRAHHRAHHHVGARLQVARLAHRGRQRARARCACPRARCRRTAGGRPATGSSRRCASARPCRWRR